jgi:hypothetical protein
MAEFHAGPLERGENVSPEDIIPFGNPDNPDECQLLTALNPFSTIVRHIPHSFRDLERKVLDALVQARPAGLHVPPCSCGHCPAGVRQRWERLFGTEPEEHQAIYPGREEADRNPYHDGDWNAADALACLDELNR